MANGKRMTLDLAHQILGSTPHDAGHRRVIEGIEERQPISQDAHEMAGREDSFGDRLADSVARIGGSWLFIGLFFAFLAGWTGLNTFLLTRSEAFDPYPYIFLNLVLSMLAAIQAPVIMMSQNRQAEKDRIAAAHDYEVNLRSEIEIIAMQQKLDRLRGEQHETILAQQAELLKLVGTLVDRDRPA